MNTAPNLIAVENDESPEYVRRQWARLLAERCSENLRYVRVWNNVATVTNKTVLIRTPVEMVDGLYTLSLSGSLDKVAGYREYPDVELLRPAFEKLRPSCKMPKADVKGFSVWLQRAREANSSVLMDKNGCCLRSEPGVRVDYPFGLPDEMLFNPTFLQLAFNSMKAYDGVYLAVEPDVVQKDRPLIIGLNWSACALVFPTGATFSGHSYW